MNDIPMNISNSSNNGLDAYVCSQCGSYLFLPVYIMKKLSRIMNPNLRKDTLQAVGTFRCMICKAIPAEIDPFELLGEDLII